MKVILFPSGVTSNGNKELDSPLQKPKVR